MIITRGHRVGKIHCTAVFEQSRDGVDFQYQYWLSRFWGEGRRYVAWLLLNPGAPDPDPIHRLTMCRIICASWNEGYDGAVVVNLYPIIAGNRHTLWEERERLQNDNNGAARMALNREYVQEASERAAFRIVAFGDLGAQWRNEAVRRDVAEAHAAFGNRAVHLGVTQNGWPYHPGCGESLRRFGDARWEIP